MIQKKINIQNKKARFEFELIDQYTAGMVLTGTEIKSIRESKASITESFCEFNERGEVYRRIFIRNPLQPQTALDEKITTQ